MNNVLDFILTKEGRRAVEVFTRQIVSPSRAVTRGSALDATVGCRWWQMMYAILVLLPYPLSTLLVWSKGINASSEWKTYQEMVEIVQAIVSQIESYYWTPLYSILYKNKVIECDKNHSGEPCLRIMNKSFVDSATDGRYYVCTYWGDLIGHYFVLERRHPTWYISSSYGSAWVRVPVQTQEVPEQELRDWLEAIYENDGKNQENGEVRDIIERFYIRYFLEGNLFTRYSENEPKSRRGLIVPREIGIKKEVKTSLNGPLRVGYIESMEEYIGTIVTNTMGHSGGSDMYKRVSNRRNRKQRLTRRGIRKSHRQRTKRNRR